MQANAEHDTHRNFVTKLITRGEGDDTVEKPFSQ